ncbi:MAG: hypothetical protein J5957_10100 [Prevotella sp.]|jgi:hypothetical protein|nr:hypothetical protein [Prevotella sp.]
MARHYLAENIENLRVKINREFLIRLQPLNGKSQLVGFTRLCSMVGDLHAEHYGKKALACKSDVPKFTNRALACQVVFYPR